MSRTKPTPGPWRYEQSTQTVRTMPENYCVVALETFGKGGSTDAAMSDLDKLGRLISQAPDMLQGLKLALDHLLVAEEYCPAEGGARRELMAKLQSIINRAEGQD